MALVGGRYSLWNGDENIEPNRLYKAIDTKTNDKKYIEIIEVTPHMKEDFLQKSIELTTVIRDIQSPYILDIIEMGCYCTQEDVFIYLVSDYCKGDTLDKIIQDDISAEKMLYILKQIVRGLEICDRYNIYHGDLKPENILVDKNNNVKLINFGLTQANKGVNPRLNHDIDHMSPSQLCINYTDKYSDMYSLGIIAFEMIFKKLPFEECDDTKEPQKLKILDKGINWLNISYDEEYDKLVSITKKLLTRDEKYQKYQEIILELSDATYEKALIYDVDFNTCNIKEDVNVHKKKNNKTKLLTVMIAIASVLALICR